MTVMLLKGSKYASPLPRLLFKLKLKDSCSIEIWTTTCIVTNFGKSRPNLSDCNVLINPGNAALSGVRNFPYFPKGGPVPKEKPTTMHKDWQPLGYVSNWGGMEVGSGMLYPASVVDGLVHQLGGWKLRAECEWKRQTSLNDPCPIGTATATSSGGKELQEHYDSIIHTTPPFYKYDNNPEVKLYECYMNSLDLVFSKSKGFRVAVPLLGSGARGFPYEVAVEVAAAATIDWCFSLKDKISPVTKELVPNHQHNIVYGLLEEEIAEQLAQAIEQYYSHKGLDSQI